MAEEQEIEFELPSDMKMVRGEPPLALRNPIRDAATLDVFDLAFSPDNHVIAAGCGDGTVRVYHSASGRRLFKLQVPHSRFPTTSVCFRPTPPGQPSVLLAGNSNGSVTHWHVSRGTLLHEIKETDNEIFATGYSRDGHLFATAGRDQTVRVYDEGSKVQVHSLTEGDRESTSGHFNRIFSLVFHPTQPNIIATGGWDQTIQLWDLRVDHSVASIHGVNICGNSMDLCGNQVLAGSWRPERPLQIYDIRSTSLDRDILWNKHAGSPDTAPNPTLVYTAQFGKQGSIIAAGGSGANEAKLFKTSTGEVLGSIQMPGSVFASAFSSDGRFVAFAGSKTGVQTANVRAKVATPE
eukprot:gnl/Dysnectes_brevis/968_a1078_3611.p1 GENE.gnl/Dysnectes_brevis/968_a1078_3611~~gnl/Dysnectes_brevis/968_a1078_3611.p1  ORF type:complete len:363 (+),score=105.30 gnl/Dysnectes_brevis/968_a1078_3611:37-1089(+)